MASLPDVGAPAPDFTLPSTSGSDVTLSGLRGRKVLLAFFPLAFTSVCTTEVCAFSAERELFDVAEVTVLPISVDSVPTLRAFKAKEGLAIDLLSDFHRQVSRLYGTLIENRFHSSRAYVLVDPAGVVRWTWEEPTTGTRRTNEEILAHVRAVA